MKTPYEKQVTTKLIEEGKFAENIIHFCKNEKNLKMLFEYLKDNDKMIKINEESNNINFNFFYCLDNLITYDSEIINFIYSHNFINCAYEYFNIKQENDRKIIIDLKIIYDLIDNYINGPENQNIEPISDKLEELKEKVEKEYLDIFNNRKDIVELFDLKDNINYVNIKKIYSKILINLFEEQKFEDYDYVNDILQSLEVDSNYVDSETIEQIKALINSGNFQNVFEITKDNCTNPKIINFLYFLLVDILNGPSDLQNFAFLSKAKKIFEEFFDIQNMKKLSLNLPVGLRKRFEKVIEIFKTYETSFTESCDLKTCFNNQTYIKVKYDNNIKKKNNDKKDVRLCETLLSTFNKHIIKRYEEYFGYDIDGIKLFDAYNFYSNEKNDKYFDEHSNNVEYFLENDSSTSFQEYLFSNSTKLISMKYIFKDNNEIKYFLEDLKIFKEYFPYDVLIKIIKIEKIIFVIVSILLRCDYLHCFLKLENREQKL